jgi:hypothetical protein
LLPNHQHSINLSISSLVDSLEMQLLLIPYSWIL